MNKKQKEKKLKIVKDFIEKKTKENEKLGDDGFNAKEKLHDGMRKVRQGKREQAQTNKKKRHARWKKGKKKRDSQSFPTTVMAKWLKIEKSKEKKDGNGNSTKKH